MTEEHEKGPSLSDEERARAMRDQLKSVHAFDLAYEMLVSLVSFGYQKMGLTDETRELRDLGDARLAIELLRANLEVLERERGGEHTRDLRSTLAQMQLGYARAVQLAGQAPAERPQAAEPAPATPADAPATTPEAPADEPGAEKPATPRPAKKPAAKKTAAKKPAPKPAARKPAAGKPAAKKPTAKKPRGGATPAG